jgi:N-acetylglucosamine-6-phosphate deacetylase
MLAITAKTLYTPLDRIDKPLLLIQDGCVLKIASQAGTEVPPRCRVRDFGDCILAPGLLDIHTHGAAGYDLMRTDADGHCRMEHFLAQHGVTSYFPTTVTAPMETTLRALDWLANAIEAQPSGELRAQPVGIHIEGPFLSHARRGMHPAEDLQKPTLSAFEKLWQAARGHISIMTIAPELDGALEVIAEATKRGVLVSMGHSDADLDEARKGVAAGVRHATHTFNAMRPLDHREPGIIGEVLTNPNLTAEIIADGIHIDPTVIDIVARTKGVENTVLITDATAATGMPEGKYHLGSVEIDVKDGKVSHNGTLAGSVLTLDRAVRNAMQFAKWDLQQAIRAATLSPANALRIRNKGSLQPGADADVVVLNPNKQVRATILKGVVLEEEGSNAG